MKTNRWKAQQILKATVVTHSQLAINNTHKTHTCIHVHTNTTTQTKNLTDLKG